MYILYLDESGNEHDPADCHFILAGAAIFERVTYFLTRDLDGLQTQHFPARQPIEFHASHMRSGSGFWRSVPQPVKDSILDGIGTTIANANQPGVVLFGAVIEKTDTLYGEAAVKLAAEQVCSRFDVFLTRREREENDQQRGLIVFAQGKYHERARLWVRGFRELGTQWGVLKNISDIPYFASTAENRLLCSK